MADQNPCVLINSLTEGGAEKALATLMPEYQRRGLNPSLICLEKNDVHKIPSITIHYLSNHTGAGEGAVKKFFSLFRFAARLKKHISTHGIRLVQSHVYRANYVNVLARILGSKHIVQLVNHGIPEQYLRGGMSGRINRMLIRWLYPRADQVLCPSSAMLTSLQNMGVEGSRLVQVPNPVDLDEIERLAAEPVPDEKFVFKPGRKYGIAIGRLEPVKRTGDIIEAFATVAASRAELDLIILGSGSEQKRLERLVARQGLGERLHLLGHVANPYQYLSRSAFLISASENEGFSLVIVEALALGIPVVATDCGGGPREILSGEAPAGNGPGQVGHAAYGLVVNVHDTAGMAKAMMLLLDDSAVHQCYAGKGKERARMYDKGLSAERYMECMDRLMGAC